MEDNTIATLVVITIFSIIEIGIWANIHLYVFLVEERDDPMPTLIPTGIFLLLIIWMGHYIFAKILVS